MMTKLDHADTTPTSHPPTIVIPAEEHRHKHERQHEHQHRQLQQGKQQQQKSRPLKTAPLLQQGVFCAAITPPASPPVPRPATDSRANFCSTTEPASTPAAAASVQGDDTCSFVQSQPGSSRQEYMDSLVPPSRDEFDKIAEVQRTKEEETGRSDRNLRRRSMQGQPFQDAEPGIEPDAAFQHQQQQLPPQQAPAEGRARSSSDAMNKAATLIQRNYRGYRVRREMKGLSLGPSTRWVTAIEEAQFRELNRPRAKSSVGATNPSVHHGDQRSVLSRDEDGSMACPTTARSNWKKAATIARRAGHDDAESDSDSSVSSSDSGESPEQKAERKRRREEAIAQRKKDSKMMGLQYFLEMVDLKHRYGSNLRVYHEEWKKSDTNENFFYWLDYGGGKNLEMEACPRDRLAREQVRYLSREERQYYLVRFDQEGRLCWAKNGARIDTTESYKDSIHGIVPADDPTPAWSQDSRLPPTPDSENDDADSRSQSSVESALEADRAAKYATPDFDGTTGMKKVSHVSVATIFNKLLRKSVKKNTWIFVADTSFRLYVGIKSSGAFQHSSFLQGSRISAAGLINIKNGRLSSLSPLSGHYRPPASNFRAFVRSLKEDGVDTSHVSISKSYAVLVGLEVYVKSRQKGKRTLEKMTHTKDKIVAPGEVRRREEEERDKSESAAREREVLEKEAEEREGDRAAVKLMRKLNLSPREPKTGDGGDGTGDGERVMETLTEGSTGEERSASGA